MFHIIEDWYLVPDTYSWMIARKIGEKKGSTGNITPKWANEKYLETPEQAMQVFINEYVRARARSEGAQGELADLLIFLSSEYKRVSDNVSLALAWAKGQQAHAARKNT